MSRRPRFLEGLVCTAGVGCDEDDFSERSSLIHVLLLKNEWLAGWLGCIICNPPSLKVVKGSKEAKDNCLQPNANV